MNYLNEKMTSVGCGTHGVVEAQTICDAMTADERDVLDCWHNLGIQQEMRQEYKATENRLREQFNQDDLIVLSAYVSGRRNVEAY